MFAKPHVFPQETPVCHCLLLVPPEFSQCMKNNHTFSSFSYHDLFLTLLSLYPTVVARRPYWSQWKWRRERNALAKFSCAEEKNSCFIQKVLKETLNLHQSSRGGCRAVACTDSLNRQSKKIMLIMKELMKLWISLNARDSRKLMPDWQAILHCFLRINIKI